MEDRGGETFAFFKFVPRRLFACLFVSIMFMLFRSIFVRPYLVYLRNIFEKKKKNSFFQGDRKFPECYYEN